MTKSGIDKKQLVIEAASIMKAALIYRAVYHPLRLKIVGIVHREGSIHVTKLVKKLKEDTAFISQQLKILRDGNILTTKRQGKRVFYLVNNTQVERLQKLSEKIAPIPNNRPSTISQKELKAMRERVQKPTEVKFSPNELAIIKLICEQKTNEEVGEKLQLSKRIVEDYRQGIIKKMNMRNTVGLALYAVKNAMYQLR